MGKEILQVAETVSNERGISESVLFEAIEAALESATRKLAGGQLDVRVSINQKTGDYATFRRWTVIEDEQEITRPGEELHLSEARQKWPQAQVGAFVEEPIPSIEFGRIAAQTAKQVIVQKVREAERRQVVASYEERLGELVMGVVKRRDRGGVIVELTGNVEALIPREEMIPRDPLRIGDRVRGLLKEVALQAKGPQLILSRTDPRFLAALFRLEVPEIEQGLVEIKGVARDPGWRAKIAVTSKDLRVDAVGACVGIRGSRVQSVSNELAGERIDVIPWDRNPVQYVINAMAPAEVVSVVMDEDRHVMELAVEDDQLARAIGEGGRNVRLANALTGWSIQVMGRVAMEERGEAEARAAVELFQSTLHVDEEMASILVQEGFATLEEIAYVPAEELTGIEGFDEELVNELRARARDALIGKEIAEQEALQAQAMEHDLVNLPGMTDELAQLLAAHDILTMDDLAEQDVDELMALAPLTEEQAKALIMAARAPWFEEQA
jgi:N utilization substance protein A